MYLLVYPLYVQTIFSVTSRVIVRSHIYYESIHKYMNICIGKYMCACYFFSVSVLFSAGNRKKKIK